MRIHFPLGISNGTGIFTSFITCISEESVALALPISSLSFDLGKQNPHRVICSQSTRVR